MPARTRQPEPRIEVITDDAFLGRAPETLVERAVEAALAAERVSGHPRVTVFLTGDKTLRDLNHRFNGVDEVTDVLSFNETPGVLAGGNETPGVLAGRPGLARTEQGEGPQITFPELSGEDARLGDIVISLPQVERQAGAAGQSVEHELAMLAVHGLLHLLGYDHADPAEERVMFGKTDQILASVFNNGASPQVAQVGVGAKTRARPVRRKSAVPSESASDLTKSTPAVPARGRALKARAGSQPE
ncbi:MAG: rRNA maturation RNase YbeY [Dehalococcoidia bacterium]|nr:rRNA maturation RNase YbeY [Dehalococcoidia bacterium]MSQ34995.1 rRNA maturation RNase YbeY [Dehalococcoidia bacterium]